jgi:hypothetical protein
VERVVKWNSKIHKICFSFFAPLCPNLALIVYKSVEKVQKITPKNLLAKNLCTQY